MGTSLRSAHQSLLQSKAVYHMGLRLLEFQSAILGTGKVLTICSEIKKIKELISGGQHVSSQYERRNRTRAAAFSPAAVPAKSKSLPQQGRQAVLGIGSINHAARMSQKTEDRTK